ncbi:unnamed protein product [Echinostoma caproni]|uniref:DUF4210 domain-containing protein n=1 Tax=Echinostoma caproni TaxID=27848 RepID=A0A183AXD0_9TREM|nr:unnamed protein product [Echinostoma caproni]
MYDLYCRTIPCFFSPLRHCAVSSKPLCNGADLSSDQQLKLTVDDHIPDWQVNDPIATDFVQRWLTLHGFQNGHHPIKFPEDFRSCIALSPAMGEQVYHTTGLDELDPVGETTSVSSKAPVSGPAAGSISRPVGLLYACLMHLCGGRSPPGVPANITLQLAQPAESLATVHFYLAALTTFVRSQGGCLPHVLPEHLMHPADYRAWYRHKRPGLTDSARLMLLPVEVLTDPRRSVMSFHSESSMSGGRNAPEHVSRDTPDEGIGTDRSSVERDGRTSSTSVIRLALSPLPELDPATFERVSKRARTDLMLQLMKVCAIKFGVCASARLVSYVRLKLVVIKSILIDSHLAIYYKQFVTVMAYN